MLYGCAHMVTVGVKGLTSKVPLVNVRVLDRQCDVGNASVTKVEYGAVSLMT